MSIAIWSDEFATGDAHVDMQHKQLFGMVNDLHDAIVQGHGKEVQGRVLKKLANYTVTHFQHEEELMRQTGYPETGSHHRIHQELAGQVTDLIKKYDAGALVLPSTLSGFLAKWLTDHIKKEDKKLIDWVHAKRAKAS